jgi:hypothetical protein
MPFDRSQVHRQGTMKDLCQICGSQSIVHYVKALPSDSLSQDRLYNWCRLRTSRVTSSSARCPWVAGLGKVVVCWMQEKWVLQESVEHPRHSSRQHVIVLCLERSCNRVEWFIVTPSLRDMWLQWLQLQCKHIWRLFSCCFVFVIWSHDLVHFFIYPLAIFNIILLSGDVTI